MRNSRFTTVLLIAACILVMGIGAAVSIIMNRKDSRPADTGAAVITPEDGEADGYIGGVMRTAFFDFTVTKVYRTDKYKTVTASEGNTLLVAEISISNTMDQPVPMFNTDFQLGWGSGDDEWCVPVDYYEPEKNCGNMFKESYTLGINKTVTGDAVYEAPADITDFVISFLEYFENEEEGDLFAVYFTAE